MKIKKIKVIENYRNLSGLTISFDEDINFIIGENNIGKTNIINLLYAFFSERRFKPTDFKDPSKPIHIEIQLSSGKIISGTQRSVNGSIHYNLDILDSFNFLYLEIPSRLKEEECIQKIYKMVNSFVHSQGKIHCIEQDNRLILPLYILIDEPENHIHPYRQRSLIKKISSILEEESIPYFGMRQIFIVTHSPNILLHSYKQFIRLYKEENQINIVSGSTLLLDNTKLYKHMLHNFIYLKEAMFSKKILFVEGDTENGAFPAFSKRMNIDFDENGVGIVKLDGAESVLRCMHLYKKFGIDSLAILDRDQFDRYGNKPNIYFTDRIDFEEDIYNHFELQDYLYCLKELSGLEHFIKILKKENIHIHATSFLQDPKLSISNKEAKKIMRKYKEVELRWLREKKNALKGALLAQYVTRIPACYVEVIEKAIKKG